MDYVLPGLPYVIRCFSAMDRLADHQSLVLETAVLLKYAALREVRQESAMERLAWRTNNVLVVSALMMSAKKVAINYHQTESA